MFNFYNIIELPIPTRNDFFKSRFPKNNTAVIKRYLCKKEKSEVSNI